VAGAKRLTRRDPSSLPLLPRRGTMGLGVWAERVAGGWNSGMMLIVWRRGLLAVLVVGEESLNLAPVRAGLGRDEDGRPRWRTVPVPPGCLTTGDHALCAISMASGSEVAVAVLGVGGFIGEDGGRRTHMPRRRWGRTFGHLDRVARTCIVADAAEPGGARQVGSLISGLGMRSGDFGEAIS